MIYLYFFNQNLALKYQVLFLLLFYLAKNLSAGNP